MSATRIGSLQVGRYTLDVVSEFEGPRILPRELYPTLQESHLGSIIPRFPKSSFDMGSKKIVTSVHAWLIRDGSGLVLLVDTCFGNNKLRPAYPPFNLRQTDWLEQLAALGVSPADVTHVINTHLDHDHVGWNTRLVENAWQPTFPRARHLMPSVEITSDASELMLWNKESYNTTAMQ